MVTWYHEFYLKSWTPPFYMNLFYVTSTQNSSDLFPIGHRPSVWLYARYLLTCVITPLLEKCHNMLWLFCQILIVITSRDFSYVVIKWNLNSERKLLKVAKRGIRFTVTVLKINGTFLHIPNIILLHVWKRLFLEK